MLNPFLLSVGSIFIDKYSRYQKVLSIDSHNGFIEFQLINGTGPKHNHLNSDKGWWNSCTLVDDTSSLGVDPWLLSQGDLVHNVLTGKKQTVQTTSSSGIIFKEDMHTLVDLNDPVWHYCKLDLDLDYMDWDDIIIDLSDITTIEEELEESLKTPEQKSKEAEIDFFFFPEKWAERVKRNQEKYGKNNDTF